MRIAASVFFYLGLSAGASAQCIDCGVYPEIPSGGAVAAVMKSIIPFYIGGTTSFSTAGTGYGVPFEGYGSVNFSTSETGFQWVIPIPGTLSYLTEYRAGAGGGTWEFRPRINATTTGNNDCVESAPSGSAASCQDTTHSDTIAAGDLLGLMSCPGTLAGVVCTLGTAPTTNTLMPISALFTSTNSGEGMLIGSTVSAVSATQNTQYSGFQSQLGMNAAETAVSCLVSAAGKLDNLYIRARVAVGAGNTDTITVFHEAAGSCGTPAATPGPLAASVSGASQTTNNDLNAGHGFTVAPGDCVAIQLTTSGTPSATAITYGMRWKPTTAGESLYCSTAPSQNNANGVTRLYSLSGSTPSTGNSTILTQASMPSIPGITYTADSFYFLGDTNAGGATSRAHNLRQSTVSGATFTPSTVFSCTQGTGALTCNNTTPAGITAGNYLDYSAVNTSTPAAGTMSKYGVAVRVQ